MFFKRIIKWPKCIFINYAKRMASGCIGRPVGSDNTFRQKYVRVSVLGAHTPTGEPTAFLLKQNPIVSRLYLYGTNQVLGIAADLQHLDTRCEVKGYTGDKQLSRAIRRADIVVIIGLDKCHASADAAVRAEADRVIKFAQACAKYAPKAIILVCVKPIACNLPLVAAVFRKTHWYHPARIIGATSLAQIRTDSLAARYQDLDPVSVHVPLVGGPDPDSVVPLFSRAEPISILSPDCEILHERIKQIDKIMPIESPCPCKVEFSFLSEAYGINQMVTTMGVGLCGDEAAVCTAFVRQNIIKTCRHLVTTVKFGPGGVVHNYGIPKLSRLELINFEKATLLLAKREKMAVDLFEQIDAREAKAKRSPQPAFMPFGHRGPLRKD